MLRAYVQKWRHRVLSLSGLHPAAASRDWAGAAFRDFVPRDGNRDAMLSTIAGYERRVAARFDAFAAGGDSGLELAKSLTDVCSWIAGQAGHRDAGLKTYVDVSDDARAMRILIDRVARLSSRSVPMEALDVTALVLEHLPTHRPALIVHAELLLERGDVEDAIDTIQRALRVQAVCTTSQELLFRAYRRKQEQGSTDPELAALDYDLKSKFCDVPFRQLATGYQGDAFICLCPAWVPYPVGNILQAESADAIWNSANAQEIRRSILDGDYSYCSRTLCSLIGAQQLPDKASLTDPILRHYIDDHVTRIGEVPVLVHLNHDPTCNLACPSCRTEVLASTAEENDQFARATERVILPLLRKVRGHAYITGGGEAFASKHFRSILKALNREEYPGLYLILITNATKLTASRWNDFPDLPEMIDIVLVSMDAASPETFEKLRRPAKWDVVMKNLEHITAMRRGGLIRNVGLNFVVQKDNFREIHDFITLGDRLGVDRFWFQRMANYGSYEEATFADIDVTSPSHPDHAALLEILRNPAMKRQDVLNMLVPVLPEAIGSEEPLHPLVTVGGKEWNVPAFGLA